MLDVFTKVNQALTMSLRLLFIMSSDWICPNFPQCIPTIITLLFNTVMLIDDRLIYTRAQL
eukprot:snap_masked-scaffold_10-processed-gene-9.7-mRNA-1 protein AED:1.00 eAED:1.00 QI:0/0/0/0/1/1/3/0/60